MEAANRASAPAALVAGALMYAGWQALRRAREADIYGQVALVTGGSRGLGLLIAHELLEAGCQVAVCARDVTELEAARVAGEADWTAPEPRAVIDQALAAS